MPKKVPKKCPKCGEPYFGDKCIGCNSNQYSHYDLDSSHKKKILIILMLVVVVVFFLIVKR